MNNTKKTSHADLIKKGMSWCIKNSARSLNTKSFYDGLST